MSGDDRNDDLRDDLDRQDHGHDDDVELLVHRADLDGLIRAIDAQCTRRDWVGLRELRDQARTAASSGRQLWPAARLAEYRLALRAPADMAAAMVDEPAGSFTVGPLSEVVAQHHRWADLAPHLAAGPSALYVAHECALRGDPPDPATIADFPPVLDIPALVQPWEPSYALAEYHDDRAEFPPPSLPRAETELTPTDRAERLDDDVDLAVRQLVDTWTASSNGRADTVCVVGDVAAAIGGLGVRSARVSEIAATDAVAWLAWAGASGGAHGRRRGAAVGRFGAWWVLAALGDLLDEWPPEPAELGDVAASLDWYRWDAHEPDLGWTLRLAIVDRSADVSWAITAHDSG